MTSRPIPTPRVVSIEMADGSDINSPEVRQQLARAFVDIAGFTQPRLLAQQPKPNKAS